MILAAGQFLYSSSLSRTLCRRLEFIKTNARRRTERSAHTHTWKSLKSLLRNYFFRWCSRRRTPANFYPHVCALVTARDGFFSTHTHTNFIRPFRESLLNSTRDAEALVQHKNTTSSLVLLKITCYSLFSETSSSKSPYFVMNYSATEQNCTTIYFIFIFAKSLFEIHIFLIRHLVCLHKNKLQK
jgi:hypothetical protein